MTEVEAIERILQGNPLKNCMHCDGMGTTPASRERYKRVMAAYEKGLDGGPMPQSEDYIHLCMRCNGVGQAVEDTYAEACRVLGRELPKPQTDFRTVIRGIQKKMAARTMELLDKYVVKNDP